jgi:hypothetical protein
MISAKAHRVDELRALAAQILQIADDLEREGNFDGASDIGRRRAYLSSWDGTDSDYLILRAGELYRARRRRKRFFPPELFGEPAWDLLLDLFIARLRNKRVSVTSACYAADVPSTTALRWLGILADRNLIERFDSKTDQRVTWVRLTTYATNLMQQFFSDMANTSRQKLISLDHYLITEVEEEKS